MSIGGTLRGEVAIDLAPGERVGDWVVGEPVGRGGMAMVYRVRSALSDRLVGAMKVLDPRAERSARARFVREIETLSALRHEGVIRVLAAGELPERFLLYMVMEYIDGEDLAQRMTRDRVEWLPACRIFRDVADALRHAHERGIQHRDLKPSNVMVTTDDRGVLVDFGIALDQGRTRLTQVGMVPGTVAYMPPELLTNDPREFDPCVADVYGFGLVFYEALTRTKAFPAWKGDDHAQLLTLIQSKIGAPPLDPGPAVPEDLRTLIRACTEAHPFKRPPMSRVVRVLDALLDPAPGTDAVDEEPTEIGVAPPRDPFEVTFAGDPPTDARELGGTSPLDRDLRPGAPPLGDLASDALPSARAAARGLPSAADHPPVTTDSRPRELLDEEDQHDAGGHFSADAVAALLAEHEAGARRARSRRLLLWGLVVGVASFALGVTALAAALVRALLP